MKVTNPTKYGLLASAGQRERRSGGATPGKVNQSPIMKTIILPLCLVAASVMLVAQTVSATTEVPRPEHPRPDAFRTNWMTLNGDWEFEIDETGDGESRGLISGTTLNSGIVVPFCPESPLSGVGRYELMKNVWYRRHFELPVAMQGKRIRLHFGGVDYQAWVWVNGRLAGSHTGGSVEFALEITGLLRDGSNELVVRAFDDTASGRQPTGKQTHTVSEGCVYTRTTGIWQPVWLEAVGSSFVEGFSIVPDPDKSRVIIEAAVNGPDRNLELTAEAFADGKRVGKTSCAAFWRDNHLVLDLSRKKLWEPGAPFLYDLKFTLSQGRQTVDEVASYFGLREVSIEGRSILINGKRIFQRLILDQGFYPDGIWTAPSDEALKRDIELSMAAGYNGARLHQKVFEPRFLFWADKLGYLVWGEFPNWGYNYQPEYYANAINEWTEIIQRDRNHPSIIGWCPFNETPREAAEIQQIVVRQTRAIDRTRPVLETSGWSHSMDDAEVRDDHDYNQDPDVFKRRWVEFFEAAGTPALPSRYAGGMSDRRDLGVPFMVSEFGGIGWATEDGWGYGNGPRTLEEFYARYAGLVDAQLDNPNLFGFCYTQLTDVEQERNGLYFYDRRPKFDVKRLHAITSRSAAYETRGPDAPQPGKRMRVGWEVLVGAAPDGRLCLPYRYTTRAPAAEWIEERFDEGRWQTGLAPFGTIANPRTDWNTGDIWLRRTFDWDGTAFRSAALVIFHDEDTEVHVNGRRIWRGRGFLTSYELYQVTDTLKGALKKGSNTLAVHTRQTGGGQFIDLALLLEPARADEPVLGQHQSPHEDITYE